MMTQALVDRKYRMIAEIIKLEDEALLTVLEDALGHSQDVQPVVPDFWDAVKPIRRGVTFEQVLAKQYYTPFSYEMFRAKADEVELEEPLEELLALLTK